MLVQIRDFLEDELRVHVVRFSPHPLGVGLFKLSSALQRDILVYQNPHHLQQHELRFLRHDQADNWREAPLLG